jgi:hypothetical protein
MAKAKYQPPKQSVFGQIIAVFGALYAPIAFNLAGAATRTILPAGVTQETGANGAITFPGATWENLGQNEVMQKQWKQLGYDISEVRDADGTVTTQSAAALITQWFDYSFSWLTLIGTALAIIGYFAFLLWYSDKEFKEVIAEKFGR